MKSLTYNPEKSISLIRWSNRLKIVVFGTLNSVTAFLRDFSHLNTSRAFPTSFWVYALTFEAFLDLGISRKNKK